MSYEVLTIIVIANALVTFALWRALATKVGKPDRLNKKAAKALWDSEPIAPRHGRPKAIGDDYPNLASDYDRRFFADFAEFGGVVNSWLADEYVNSRWRLQELPKTELSLGFRDSPEFGRCYKIFYNQTHLGELEISPAYKYTTEAPQVFTSIEIRWVRFLSYSDIRDFLAAIAMHVTDPRPNSAEAVDVRQNINSALTETLWDLHRTSKYPEFDGQDWGEIALSFHGSAEYYIDRRPGWRQTMTENAAKATAQRPKATETNRERIKEGLSAVRVKGILIGAAIGLAISLVSAASNSTFSGADLSPEWIAHNIGYFAPWALVGGVIGFFSTKKKQQP